MPIQIAAELVLSTLAVFGAYALFRLLVTARFLPEKSGLCVRIDAKTARAALPQLLQSAHSMASCIAGGRVICFVEADACEDVIAYLEESKVTYYRI